MTKAINPGRELTDLILDVVDYERRAQGYSRAQLSCLSGIPLRDLRRVLDGRMSLTIDELAALATPLRTSVVTLLDTALDVRDARYLPA